MANGRRAPDAFSTQRWCEGPAANTAGSPRARAAASARARGARCFLGVPRVQVLLRRMDTIRATDLVAALQTMLQLLLALQHMTGAASPPAPSAQLDKLLVYNNDLTNIESCSSPYHEGTATSGEPFTLDMLNASIQETANMGFDVHELAPGCCYVPWWNNATVISIPEHVDWWTHTFYKKDGSLPPNRTEGFMEHLMRGGDIIGPFIEYTRAAKMKAFVSWRMSDSQAFSNFAARPLEDQLKDTAKFWYDNRYNATMGLSKVGGYYSVQNWMVPEVRAYKMQMLQDIITMYKPDGISLDFERAPLFFDTTKTTSSQRKAIMGGWLRNLRARMTAGGVRTLCARVPPSLGTLDAIGLDVAALTAEGVFEFLTLGINYDSFLPQDSDFGAIKAQVPKEFQLNWEVSYVERQKQTASCSHGPDQRMTKAHLATSAHQAYYLGAAGMSSFNFQYYRQYADKPCMLEENSPYSEPPFGTLAKLKDPEWVAQQHQYYWSNNKHTVSRTPTAITMVLVPPTGGWRVDGKVRINYSGSGQLSLRMNGRTLIQTTDTAIPWESEYADRFEDEYSAWQLPAVLVHTGSNSLQITLTSSTDESDAVTITHVDILLPSGEGPAPVPPPPKTLHFNNDLTNTLTCISPFHTNRSSGFTREVLAGSVRETAKIGVQTHLLAPGFSWVPWWNSTLAPPAAHDAWYKSAFNFTGAAGGDFFAYVLRGSRGVDAPDSGDILGEFVSLTKSIGQRGALSFRIADYQFCNRNPDGNYEDLSEFWFSHRLDPSFMISGKPFDDAACRQNKTTGKESGHCNCDAMASMSWSHPEVAQRRQALLVEAIRMYPTLDVEVDFLRSPILFNTSTTPLLQRAAVLRTFFVALRAAMAPGTRLGVRIPVSVSLQADLGVDLAALAADSAVKLDYALAGIDYFSFLASFSDFAATRSAVPRPFPLYYEVSGFESPGKQLPGCAVAGHARLTDEQLATVARDAYAQGADGISAFNFQYYRYVHHACQYATSSGLSRFLRTTQQPLLAVTESKR